MRVPSRSPCQPRSSGEVPVALSFSFPRGRSLAPSEYLGERPPRTDPGWSVASRCASTLFRRGLPGSDLVRDEHVLAGELLELRSRPTEVGGEHVGRIAGDPFRQIDLLVDPGVEPDQDAALPVADVFDRVPVPLRGETDVALFKRLRPVRPPEPNSVMLAFPSRTYCHSSAVGCQCSSRSAPARVRGLRR